MTTRTRQPPDGRRKRYPVSLYLIAFATPDAGRRRRLRALLRYHGVAVLPDLWEVPGTVRDMRRLRRALDGVLRPEDEVRIYPVCRRCRARARAHGTGDFAGLPVAWIF